jgi:hypothetical protein
LNLRLISLWLKALSWYYINMDFFEVITFSTSPLAPLLIKERGKFILKVLSLIRRGFR